MVKEQTLIDAIQLLIDGAILVDDAKLRWTFDGSDFCVDCNKSAIGNMRLPFTVHPYCGYALDQILELGGDEAMEAYSHWLAGGKLETKPMQGEWKDADFCTLLDGDPLAQFKELWHYWGGRVRIKPAHVTRTLWVCDKLYLDRKGGCFRPECMMPENLDASHIGDFIREYVEWQDMSQQQWHKVPTFTRNPEVVGHD